MSDAAYIAAVLAAAAVATAMLARTLGRRLARRSRTGAIVFCGLTIPIVVVVAAYASYHLAADQPGDGPVMALSGTPIDAAWATPLTLLVALLTIRRWRHPGR